MPYVNCPECGNRQYVLAPWSAVGRCPTCDAPLSVPRQSIAGEVGRRRQVLRPAATPAALQTEPASTAAYGLSAARIPFAEPQTSVQSWAFQARTLSGLRRFLYRRAEVAGFSTQATDDLILAVNEVATNSVVHGGGSGVLRVWPDGDGLVCEVADTGSIDDPLVRCELPEPDQADGWGLWLAKELCDLVQVRSFSRGSAVRLHKRRD